uniref:type I restriction enzyme HsdR N-terminal domain-containing protein n=1 Tax=Segatella hominis TaxID=2518605 RepID=UPI0040250811
MTRLNLPPFEIKLRGTKARPQIFDILRKKYIALTPEEWVRQHFVHFLVEHKGYPASLMANEIQLKVGEKTLRADSVLYSRDLKPRMIIEYKAPHIPITQKVFDQISIYNMLLHVDYLVVSNGLQHYICKMDYNDKKYLFLEDIPDYEELLTE